MEKTKVMLMRFWLNENINKVAEDNSFRQAHHKALILHAMKHLLVAAVFLAIMLSGTVIARMAVNDTETYLGLFVRFSGMWGCLNFIIQSTRPFAWAMSNKCNFLTLRLLPAKTVEYFFEKYNDKTADENPNEETK